MSSFIFLADGFEEIEAIATLDILRRAGMDVKTVSIKHDHKVKGAHGLEVTADLTFKEADFAGADWLILPGGMPGATHLHQFSALTDLLKVHSTKGRIAAICASPAVVLAPAGLLNGRQATCYPGFEEELTKGNATHNGSDNVVTDGNIVTANGPAAAAAFALQIVALTCGTEVADNVSKGMLY